MSDELPEIPVWLDWLGAVSPAGLVVLTVLWVFSGRLIPRSSLPFLIAERDQRLKEVRKEADDWQSAFLVSQEESRELREQVEALLEHAEVTVALLQSIKDGG